MTRGPANTELRMVVPFAKPREISLKLEGEFQVLRKDIDAILKGKRSNV
jgi:hypothetical protein